MIHIITEKRLRKMLKDAYSDGISLRKYVDGLGNKGAILSYDLDKALDEIMKSKGAC